MPINQMLRLGTHSEAEYLRKLPNTFDTLVLNANLVQGTPAATASLVYTLKKPYIIDPFTHAFSTPPRFLQSRQKDKKAEMKPKRSFRDLATRYFGENEFVGKSALSPALIDAKRLAANVLDFQLSWFVDVVANDDFILSEGMAPAMLIAPYFPIRSGFDWLSKNIDCLVESLRLVPECAALLPLSMDVLMESAGEIALQYCRTGVKRLFLWIESFDEDHADSMQLSAYCRLIKSFSENGIEVFNLFGGFFSCIAAHYGLSGFVHGLVYGENKSFTPVVGGGQPPPRYYFKTAHVTIGVPEAENLLVRVEPPKYIDEVCNCAICKRLIVEFGTQSGLAKFAEVNEENRFTPLAYAYSRFHFLLARRDEVRTYSNFSTIEARNLLERNASFTDLLGATDLSFHLRRWAQMIA